MGSKEERRCRSPRSARKLPKDSRADANMLLHPFLLFAGNEQVCRETAGLKSERKASLLVSMNFTFLGLWLDAVPGRGRVSLSGEGGMTSVESAFGSGSCVWPGGAGPGMEVFLGVEGGWLEPRLCPPTSSGKSVASLWLVFEREQDTPRIKEQVHFLAPEPHTVCTLLSLLNRLAHLEL